jgi:hypothetical protein
MLTCAKQFIRTVNRDRMLITQFLRTINNLATDECYLINLLFLFSVTDAMSAQGKRVPDVLSGGSSSDAYVRILKHKFEATVGTPAWAELGHRNTRKSIPSDDDDDDDDDDDSDSELLRVRKLLSLVVFKLCNCSLR